MKYGKNVRQHVALSILGRGVPGYYPEWPHLANKNIFWKKKHKAYNFKKVRKKKESGIVKSYELSFVR